MAMRITEIPRTQIDGIHISCPSYHELESGEICINGELLCFHRYLEVLQGSENECRHYKQQCHLDTLGRNLSIQSRTFHAK